MTIHELTRDQLIQVKQNYYVQKQEAKGKGVSWGELADIDLFVSDKTIFKEEAGTDFVEDDFF